MIPIGGAAPSFTRSIRGRSPITTATAPATSLGIIDRLPYLAGSASTRSGSARGTRRRWPTAATTSATTATSILTSARSPQADTFIASAHDLGLRVLIDLVPNHSSDRHPWFQAALAAGPGSPSASCYIFRDGAGSNGGIPPNNWPAMFGGRAWERTTNADGHAGQWYLHLFAPEQPDWNWENPAVADGVRRDPAVLVRPRGRRVPDRRRQLDGQGARPARPGRRPRDRQSRS